MSAAAYPPRKGIGCFGVLGIVTAVIIVGGLILLGISDDNRTPRPLADSSLQAKRKQVIDETLMGDGGMFEKVDTRGGVRRLWVKPAFYLLDFDLKSKAVGVVYAYEYQIPRGGGSDRFEDLKLELLDNRTGKKIGEYGQWHGGLKLY